MKIIKCTLHEIKLKRSIINNIKQNLNSKLKKETITKN